MSWPEKRKSIILRQRSILLWLLYSAIMIAFTGNDSMHNRLMAELMILSMVISIIVTIIIFKRYMMILAK